MMSQMTTMIVFGVNNFNDIVMKKIFLALVLSVISIASFAYDNGDKFTVDNITYEIISTTAFTLRAISASEGAVVDNAVTVPYEVYDPKDYTIKYTVKDVRFYGNNTLPTTVKKVIMSEGIKELTSLYTNNQVEEIHIPTTATIPASPLANKLRKFVIADGNPYLKFVPETADPDGEAGFLLTADGKRCVYHVTPKTNIYTDNTLYLPEGVESTSGFLLHYEPNFVNTVHLPSSLNDFGTSESSNSNIKAFVIENNDKYATFDGVLYIKTDGEIDGKPAYDLCSYPHGKENEKFVVWEQCTRLGNLCCEGTLFKIIDLNKVKIVEQNAFRFNNVQKIIFTDYVEEYTNSQVNKGRTTTFVFRSEDDNTELTEEQKLNAEHKYFNLVNGILMSKDGKTVIACPAGRFNGETYILPDEVEELHPYAFYYSTIKEFISGTGLKKIGASGFGYSYFEKADFSKSSNLTSLAGLHNSASLKDLTLSPSIKTMSGFTGCTSLENIVVPDGSQLTSIGGNAFPDLKSLKSFVFEGSAPNFTTVGSTAFKGCVNLETIVLPPTTTTIGASAFSGCASLHDVNMGNNNSMTTIARNAFAGSGIQTIVLPSTIKTIEAEAFMDCNVLETIYIPAATTSISPETFKYCTHLTNIVVDKGNTVYSSVDGYLLSKDKEELKLFPPGKANDRFTLLPPSVTKIGDWSFYYCVNLKNVTIPNKVTAIGEKAFSLCDNLNTITFLCDAMIDPAKISQGQNVQAIDDEMFKNININVRKDLIDEYKAEEFYNKFKSINPSFLVDDKNEYIAVSDQAVDLLDIQEQHHTYVVPGTVTNPAGNDMIVALIGDYACQNTPGGIKEIVTFNNVEYIGANAFKQTSGDQSIENIFFCQKDPTKQLLSTTRFELTPEDLGPSSDKVYKEFADGMKVYVRKSAYNKCITDWAAYKDMIDYKIKDAQVANKYGTFSREFDVDLAQCLDETTQGKKVLAFTGALTGVASGAGDYGESEYYIRMESINVGAEGDGTYVPKNTGVLLKVMDADATDANTFYTISDRNDDNLAGYTGENVMKGVTVDAQSISTTGKSIYVMQGGLFRYVNPQKTTSLDMPIHKAYLELPAEAAGAKVVFVMDEETAIDVVNPEMNNSPVYNLQGIQVKAPQRGIYIQNGKKIMFK